MKILITTIAGILLLGSLGHAGNKNKITTKSIKITITNIKPSTIKPKNCVDKDLKPIVCPEELGDFSLEIKK